MQFSSITSGAAVLLALAQTALSLGNAHVVNKCGFPVYYASILPGVAADMVELPAEGFSEIFKLPGQGISIKLATSKTEKPTQFEYTWAANSIFYDISNIDGNPFQEWGMILSPSNNADAANPTCKDVVCPAGESPCVQAYNQWDDVRTMVCGADTDLTMTLCPNGTSTATPTLARRHARVHPRHLKF